MWHYNKKIRNSFNYKIKMWFLKVTFRDIIKYCKILFSWINEFIIIGIIFILIFILPHFFH